MKLAKSHYIGIVSALVLLAGDLIFLRGNKIFYLLIGLALVLGALPFVFSLALESSRERENNQMFLEFSRNLVESVKAGTPISRGIILLKDKNYGTLSPHVTKLANQISLGISVKESLETFARETKSSVIKRAVILISEAEKAGGNIGDILDAVAKSVAEVEKLKKERAAAISALVVQGYIIFFVFIAIMIIMQFKILPMTSDISVSGGGTVLGSIGSATGTIQEASQPILYLLVVQGFFTGLIIGKLAEGTIKSGIKHSFIMAALALLVYAIASMFF